MTEAPSFIQPVIGYRKWRVREDGLLVSVHRQENGPWPVRGETTARCAICERYRPSEELPGRNHRCGIYAHYRIEHTTGDFTQYHGFVLGAVACWGKVVPHRELFRAQTARVVALCGDDGALENVGGLGRHPAELYEVPYLRTAEELRDAAAAHGEELPLTVRPPAEWAPTA